MINKQRFRVWLYNDAYPLGRYFTPEDNNIGDNTSLVMNLSGDVVAVQYLKPPNANLGWARIGSNGITVNQSTGTIDSQGTEIFEDDVVEFDDGIYFVLNPYTLTPLRRSRTIAMCADGECRIIGKIAPIERSFYKELNSQPPADFYFLEDYNN